MNNKMKNIVTVFAILFCLKTAAQQDPKDFLPNITPPSPVAYELGKYGNQAAGMFTGSTDASIPLCSYKTNNLNVPISLLYSKNGIKVDETSGNVGLGWNINMGGVINRVIRDLEDDSNMQFPGEGVFAEGMNSEKYNYYYEISGPNADSEPDLFSFNFNGNSGQFVYSSDGSILMLKSSKIQIQKTYMGFKATDIDGVQYFFNVKETSRTFNNGSGHQEPNFKVTAWYLNKIMHPNGDEVYLEYETYDYIYSTSKAQTLLVPAETGDVCEGNGFDQSIIQSNIFEDFLDGIGKRLNRIYSNNIENGELLITYGHNDPDIEEFKQISLVEIIDRNANIVERFDFKYLNATSDKVFLTDIAFLDPSKNYKFEYVTPNLAPRRLSLAQDLWGFYNGKSNTSIIPAGLKGYGLRPIDYTGANRESDILYSKIGMLNKITYPTKGYTLFEHESNDYFGQQVIPAPILSYNISVNWGLPDNYIVENMTFPVDTKVTVKLSALQQIGGCPPGGHHGPPFQGSFSVTKLGSSGNVPLYDENDDLITEYSISNSIQFYGSGPTVQFNATAGSTYGFTLIAESGCTTAKAVIKYSVELPETIDLNLETAGVRVAMIKDYDHNGQIIGNKKYYYSKSKDELNHSSGRRIRANSFYGDLMEGRRGGCAVPCEYISKLDWIVTSGSFSILYDDQGSNVNYSNVIESAGGEDFENGGIEHQFKIHLNSPGNPLRGMDIKSTPMSNTGWDNGNELVTTTYSKKTNGLSKINEKFFEYTRDTIVNKAMTIFACRKNFDLICNGLVSHECSAEEAAALYLIGYNCVTPHQHINFANTNVCIAPAALNVPVMGHSGCFSTYPGPVINTTNIENLSIKTYKIQSNWYYLKSQKEIQYDLDGGNPIENLTTYQYNNPAHQQLSSELKTNSFQEEKETRYYYPGDTEVAGEPVIAKLLDKNMINKPIKTETYLAGVKLFEQKTIYKDYSLTSSDTLLLPQHIYAAKFPNANPVLPDGSHLEKKITFDYNIKGNLIQYVPENGIPVSFIWGYSGTKPVAKIENIGYSSLPSNLISGIETASGNSGSEASLQLAFNALRNSNALQNAMVTTFSYIPLIGLSIVTDPKGISSKYFYDGYGRLQFVKDNEGYIVGENQYHYKN